VRAKLAVRIAIVNSRFHAVNIAQFVAGASTIDRDTHRKPTGCTPTDDEQLDETNVAANARSTSPLRSSSTALVPWSTKKKSPPCSATPVPCSPPTQSPSLPRAPPHGGNAKDLPVWARQQPASWARNRPLWVALQFERRLSRHSRNSRTRRSTTSNWQSTQRQHHNRL